MQHKIEEHHVKVPQALKVAVIITVTKNCHSLFNAIIIRVLFLEAFYLIMTRVLL